MSVRPHPTRAGEWVIDYYPQGRRGKRERVVLRCTKIEAIEYEQSLRLESKATTPTALFPKVSEVIPSFVDWYRLDHQPGGVDRTIRSIAILLRYFGPYQFTSLTEELIEAYKRDRLRLVQRTTINKELAALSKLCKWAKKKGYCDKMPVVERFPHKMTIAPLPFIPDQADIEKVIAATPWPKSGILYCLYYGGLRKEEAATLRAEQVNLEQKSMYITGKGGKERVVPILRYLEPILARRLAEVQSGYLWATPESGRALTDLRGIIKWAMKRSGVTSPITPHSLRHAFAVRAVMAGVHLRTIQIILGHSSVKVTEIYTRLAAGQIVEEMNKF
jgi:integrase/recombinase XerD